MPILFLRNSGNEIIGSNNQKTGINLEDRQLHLYILFDIVSKSRQILYALM